MAAREAVAKHGRGRGQAQKNESNPPDASDPATQNAILNPDGIEVTLFGDRVRVYPLPARWSLRFTGFTAQVMGAVSLTQGEDVTIRVGGVLAEHYVDRFLPYVARSLQRPDAQLDDAKVASLVSEISRKMNSTAFRAFAELFLLMVSQNETMQQISGLQTKN